MLICDIAAVGPAVHYTHLALHLGLAGIVSAGGGVFLGLGIVASLRARRARRALASAAEVRGPRGPQAR